MIPPDEPSCFTVAPDSDSLVPADVIRVGDEHPLMDHFNPAPEQLLTARAVWGRPVIGDLVIYPPTDPAVRAYWHGCEAYLAARKPKHWALRAIDAIGEAIITTTLLACILCERARRVWVVLTVVAILALAVAGCLLIASRPGR